MTTRLMWTLSDFFGGILNLFINFRLLKLLKLSVIIFKNYPKFFPKSKSDIIVQTVEQDATPPDNPNLIHKSKIPSFASRRIPVY